MNGQENDELMTKSEIEKYVIQLLSQGRKFTTKEIVALVERGGLTCPDEPVRFLNKMRFKGQIKGKLSMEHKGWLWWVDETVEEKTY